MLKRARLSPLDNWKISIKERHPDFRIGELDGIRRKKVFRSHLAGSSKVPSSQTPAV